jgi:hypothetical protein
MSPSQGRSPHPISSMSISQRDDGLAPVCPHTLAARASACLTCAVGTFAYADEATACESCYIGKYGVELSPPSYFYGRFVCEWCGGGTFNTAEGTTSCTSCEAGKYNWGDGYDVYDSCHLCPVGTFAPGPSIKQSECGTCSPGTYAAEEGASACTRCTAGTYSEGYAACEPCAIGHYMPQHGASACRLCTPGFYSNQTGAAACVDCQPFTRPSPASCKCLPGYDCLYNQVLSLRLQTDSHDEVQLKGVVAEIAKVPVEAVWISIVFLALKPF